MAITSALDAFTLDIAAIPTSTVLDAEPPDAPALDAARNRDAATIKKPDAGLDAGVVIPDAPPPLDATATPVPPDAPDADVRPGAIIVKNDLYCEIFIDGISAGQKRNVPLKVTSGHHLVRCEHAPTTWTEPVDIAPGETRTLVHQMMQNVDVTIALTKSAEVTIDGTKFPATGRTTLKAERHSFLLPGGQTKYITITASCVVRDQPELDCYR